MLIITLFFIISLIISSAFMLLANIMSNKYLLDMQKMSPYECGFNPVKKARMPFSLRFFLVIIIFLIFDVEITLLLPMGMITTKWNYPLMSKIMVILLLLMIIGFLHEWNQGSLNWLY